MVIVVSDNLDCIICFFINSLRYIFIVTCRWKIKIILQVSFFLSVFRLCWLDYISFWAKRKHHNMPHSIKSYHIVHFKGSAKTPLPKIVKIYFNSDISKFIGPISFLYLARQSIHIFVFIYKTKQLLMLKTVQYYHW